MQDLRDLLECENATAISLASIVVNKYESNECHFPISMAFSTIVGKAISNPSVRVVFHLDPEIYKEYPFYDQFIYQLEAERDSNPECRFYFGGTVYYSLEDIQEALKDILSDVTLGGHYYFKYVLPLLKKYRFLEALDKKNWRKVDEYAFDTVSLYLFDRFFGFNSLAYEKSLKRDSMPNTCKELFEYFSELNSYSGGVFNNTKLSDLYFDLFEDAVLSPKDLSLCINRADAIIRIFSELLIKMKEAVYGQQRTF